MPKDDLIKDVNTDELVEAKLESEPIILERVLELGERKPWDGIKTNMIPENITPESYKKKVDAIDKVFIDTENLKGLIDKNPIEKVWDLLATKWSIDSVEALRDENKISMIAKNFARNVMSVDAIFRKIAGVIPGKLDEEFEKAGKQDFINGSMYDNFKVDMVSEITRTLVDMSVNMDLLLTANESGVGREFAQKMLDCAEKEGWKIGDTPYSEIVKVTDSGVCIRDRKDGQYIDIDSPDFNITNIMYNETVAVYARAMSKVRRSITN